MVQILGLPTGLCRHRFTSGSSHDKARRWCTGRSCSGLRVHALDGDGLPPLLRAARVAASYELQDRFSPIGTRRQPRLVRERKRARAFVSGSQSDDPRLLRVLPRRPMLATNSGMMPLHHAVAGCDLRQHSILQRARYGYQYRDIAQADSV